MNYKPWAHNLRTVSKSTRTIFNWKLTTRAVLQNMFIVHQIIWSKNQKIQLVPQKVQVKTLSSYQQKKYVDDQTWTRTTTKKKNHSINFITLNFTKRNPKNKTKKRKHNTKLNNPQRKYTLPYSFFSNPFNSHSIVDPIHSTIYLPIESMRE